MPFLHHNKFEQLVSTVEVPCNNVMITVHGDPETKIRRLLNGAEALLTKPIDSVAEARSCHSR
jgi:FixJ family two-component response regulator